MNNNFLNLEIWLIGSDRYPINCIMWPWFLKERTGHWQRVFGERNQLHFATYLLGNKDCCSRHHPAGRPFESHLHELFEVTYCPSSFTVGNIAHTSLHHFFGKKWVFITDIFHNSVPLSLAYENPFLEPSIGILPWLGILHQPSDCLFKISPIIIWNYIVPCKFPFV